MECSLDGRKTGAYKPNHLSQNSSDKTHIHYRFGVKLTFFFSTGLENRSNAQGDEVD